MAKRIQNQKEEKRVVSKSRPAVMKMSSYFIATSSSAASSPIASESPELSTALRRRDSRMSVETKLIRRSVDGLMKEQRGRPVTTRRRTSEESDNSEAEVWFYEGEPVVHNPKVWEKPLAHGVSSSVDQESEKNTEATWYNCLQLSIPKNQFTNAVFSWVFYIYGKYHDESTGDLNVHLDIWRMFLYSTLQALIFIGKQVRVISSIIHGRRIWRNHLVT